MSTKDEDGNTFADETLQLEFAHYLADSIDKKPYPCPECGKAFDSVQGRGVHRGHVHGSTVKEVNCWNCGTDVERHECELYDGRWVVCSEGCHGELVSTSNSGSRERGLKGWYGEYSCEHCQRAYESEKSLEMHLSKTHGVSGVDTECSQCGNPINRPQSLLDRTENPVCSKKCGALFREGRLAGPDNPNWKEVCFHHIYWNVRNGLSGGRRAWLDLAEEVREAHGRECQNCGTHEGDLERKLEVHHVVPVLAGGVNVEELLLPLCRSCHRRAENHTADLFETFAEIA